MTSCPVVTSVYRIYLAYRYECFVCSMKCHLFHLMQHLPHQHDSLLHSFPLSLLVLFWLLHMHTHKHRQISPVSMSGWNPSVPCADTVWNMTLCLPPCRANAGQTIGPLKVIYADILGWEVELFWMDWHKENKRNIVQTENVCLDCENESRWHIDLQMLLIEKWF